MASAHQALWLAGNDQKPRPPRGYRLRGGSQSKEHVRAWKPTRAQAPFQTTEVRIPQKRCRQQNCWKLPSAWFWFEARLVIRRNNKYWRAFPLPVCVAGRHQSCWIRLFLNSHSTCFPQIAACISGKSPVVLWGVAHLLLLFILCCIKTQSIPWNCHRTLCFMNECKEC